MGAFSFAKKKLGDIVAAVEGRTDRRVGEVVVKVAELLDESDAVSGLTEDAMDTISKKFELVISIRKKQ